MMATNVHYLDASPTGADKQTQFPAHQITERLCSQTLEQFKILIEDTFGAIDDIFFKRAEKAINNSEQSAYLDGMRLVRMQQTAIKRTFLNDISSRFDKFLEQPLPAPVEKSVKPGFIVPDGLSLVEDNQLEESLALTGMVARARTCFSLPLSQLETRLAFLINRKSIDSHSNSVDPEIIANAFDGAIRDLELSLENKLIIFKLFDQHLISHVGELYKKLNLLLIDADILAEFAQNPWLHHQQNQKREHIGSAHLLNTQEQGPTVTSCPSAVNANTGPLDLFQLMQQFLNASASFKHIQHDTPLVCEEHQPAWNAEKLINALSTVQNKVEKEEKASLNSPPSYLNKDNLKQRIIRIIKQSSSEQKLESFGRNEDNVIDIVGMLFDFILDDQGIPDTIKALIGRLQIPMLKVGILDKTFFSKKQHPARMLLNDLARAGTGWNEDDSIIQQGIYAQMKHTINRILNEFDDNISIFVELQKEFSEFLSAEQSKTKIIEERTQQAEEGKSRVAEAHIQIQKEIETRAQVSRLPETMTALLHQVWSKIPLLAYLREGPNSKDWQQNIATLDKLAWTLVPKQTGEERKKLLITIPGLLQELRLGFSQVQCNPMDTVRFFKTLEACHISCIRASSHRDSHFTEKQITTATNSKHLTLNADQSKPALSPRDQPNSRSREETHDIPLSSPIKQKSGPPSPEKDKYLQELAAVPLGSWFLFTHPKKQKRRGKLSIRIAGGGNYVFVNRAGAKILEQSASDLAQGMRLGHIKILADDLILDRALDSVLKSLRQMHDSLL
ncbi:Protein of unknown function DUF1631 [Nitrosococcus oceani ATCC 19707]|uniref:Thymidine phosphorylase n=3 Tax=Nitrosococcus oceani TaxID=1229 RepID=Q3J9C2_NITOC|nr:DUF1631 domain-containing protein [Nitrosococcus oceani]ABA58574.1 Protein of unknown function DUF1631 [Nitrosococcus oceani ATCC 19707]EDZ67809.1 conserved hypothetical protein [Nitrosococcus oceani AFC27]KFI18997.1 hypothetical protein IB75_11265 [Nitrosococcus oceani C-27]